MLVVDDAFVSLCYFCRSRASDVENVVHSILVAGGSMFVFK